VDIITRIKIDFVSLLLIFFNAVLCCIHSKQFDLKTQLLNLALQLPSESLVGRATSPATFWRELKARTDLLQAYLPEPTSFVLYSQPKVLVQTIRQNVSELKSLVRIKQILRFYITESSPSSWILFHTNWSIRSKEAHSYKNNNRGWYVTGTMGVDWLINTTLAIRQSETKKCTASVPPISRGDKQGRR